MPDEVYIIDEEDFIEGLVGRVWSQQRDKVSVVVRWDQYGDRVGAVMKLARKAVEWSRNLCKKWHKSTQ